MMHFVGVTCIFTAKLCNFEDTLEVLLFQLHFEFFKKRSQIQAKQDNAWKVLGAVIVMQNW